jgi:hypothetical protein
VSIIAFPQQQERRKAPPPLPCDMRLGASPHRRYKIFFLSCDGLIDSWKKIATPGLIPNNTLTTMKHFPSIPHAPPAKRLSLALTLALTMTLASHKSEAAVSIVDLASAANFAVLAGSGITIAAPVHSTFITGDIGSFPTTSITGLGNLVLDGTNHGGDGITQQAKTDLNTAYTEASGRAVDVIFPAIHDIGGQIFTSGIYQAPSSLAVTGLLTLDALGDPNAIWIFLISSTLTTASSSAVELVNGAKSGHVYWLVGTSATIGTGSDFKGTILAQQSITVTTNAMISGRALALHGAVTMDNNGVIVPEPASSALFCIGLSVLSLARRRSVSPQAPTPKGL